MKKALAAVVLAALTLTTAGCGNKDDEKAASAISGSIMKEQKSGGAASTVQITQKQADCIGNGMVDKIGTDQLQKYGVMTKDLKVNKDVTAVKMSHGDAVSATDTFFNCADVMGMMKKAMDGAGQMPTEVKACMDKALTESAVRQMFVGMFSGDKNASKGLTSSMMKCAALGMNGHAPQSQ